MHAHSLGKARRGDEWRDGHTGHFCTRQRASCLSSNQFDFRMHTHTCARTNDVKGLTNDI